MRTQIVLLIWILAVWGCTEFENPGAGTPGSGPAPDNGPMCDPMARFDAPVPATGVPFGGSFTADELEVYFTGSVKDPNTNQYDDNIYMRQRSTISQPFGASIAITGVSTLMDERAPSVRGDGLMLFFEAGNTERGDLHLYMSTRRSRDGEFGVPAFIPNVNSTARSGDSDTDPFVTADGKELWFTSYRSAGLGSTDIYRAIWNGSFFANVSNITVLNSDSEDYRPLLSANILTIYFTSYRMGGKGKYDIWTAHRRTTSDEFPAPSPVLELNSSGSEFAYWLSPDNCRLYFGSDVSGTFDLYVATRHPL